MTRVRFKSITLEKKIDGLFENMDEVMDKCALNKENAFDTAGNFIKCVESFKKSEYEKYWNLYSSKNSLLILSQIFYNE